LNVLHLSRQMSRFFEEGKAMRARFWALAAAPARAEDYETCLYGQGQAVIDACTRLTDSGSVSADGRAIFLYLRGIAYNQLGQHARAIQDFDEEIRLKPDDAGGFYSRSLAEREMDNIAAADADLAKAKAIDPNVDQ
jgi:tetratricopeptide (TPR) repeat protein